MHWKGLGYGFAFGNGTATGHLVRRPLQMNKNTVPGWGQWTY